MEQGTKLTKEERERNTKEYILKYLVSEKMHDYEKLARNQVGIAYKTIPEALEFIKKNMSFKDYIDFHRKALPFEPCEGFTKQEADSLKQKALAASILIAHDKGALLEMLDVTPNIHQFRYMAKQLKYKYNLINAAMLKNINETYNNVYLWNCNGLADFSSRYLNLSDEDNEKLFKLLKDRNIPLNNITYCSAYITAVRTKLVNPRSGKVNLCKNSK